MVNVINDLNQETVAGMLGMSAVAYGRIERNETDISLKRINQIAKALNTDIENLLNFDSKKHIVQMKNNQNTIRTSVNYKITNTTDESFYKIIINLNKSIIQLNNIILQINKK